MPGAARGIDAFGDQEHPQKIAIDNGKGCTGFLITTLLSETLSVEIRDWRRLCRESRLLVLSAAEWDSTCVRKQSQETGT